MLRTLRNSVAVLAAASAFAAPLAAQTAATPPVVPAPVQTAPAAPAPATALPAALTELGITDARVLEGRRGGQRVEGTLPGGQTFRAMLDDKAQLRMIGVGDDAALPADIVSRLVPETVRANPIFAEFKRVQRVARGEEGVMLFGADAQNEGIRAGFSTDGTLQRFGRGDMDRDHDRRDKDDRGKHEGRKGPSHERGRGGPEGAPDAARMPGVGQPGAPLDDAAIQGVLRDGGYTQPGAITRNGPRTEVEAMNPEGEPVTVTVNPRGVVVRELAR